MKHKPTQSTTCLTERKRLRISSRCSHDYHDAAFRRAARRDRGVGGGRTEKEASGDRAPARVVRPRHDRQREILQLKPVAPFAPLCHHAGRGFFCGDFQSSDARLQIPLDRSRQPTRRRVGDLEKNAYTLLTLKGALFVPFGAHRSQPCFRLLYYLSL